MINNILYLNNRYITSYKDLKAIFVLLKDEKKRPEFLQDEILEAFYSTRLISFVEELGLDDIKTKLEVFAFSYYNSDSESKENRDILDELFKIILSDTYHIAYKCQDYIDISSVSASRGNIDFTGTDIIRFNKNVTKNEFLTISIKGEVKKVINGTINLLALIYQQDGEKTQIQPMSLSFNLANCKDKERVSANCKFDIKDIKQLQEANYVIIVEDEMGNKIHKQNFVVHSEFDNEIPLEFIGYSIKEGNQEKSGILFNRQAPSEGYEVEFKFKVKEASDASVRFRIVCHELNFNNDNDNLIDLREKNKNDIVSYKLNIKFSQEISDALDGRYRLICYEYCSSKIVFPQLYICIYGGKYNCQLDGISDDVKVLELTSYCDNDNPLLLISDYIDSPIMSLAYPSNEWSPTNIVWDYRFAQHLVEILNKKNPSKHFFIPNSDLILKTRSLITKYRAEYTDDFHDPIWGPSEVLVVKRDGKQEWKGLLSPVFSFRLCLRHVEPDTPEDYTSTDDDWYLYRTSHYD